MTAPSAYRMNLAHVRADLAASMGGYLAAHATTVGTHDEENDETVVNAAALSGIYNDNHFDGAWVHFRTNVVVAFDAVSYYVKSSAANGDLTLAGQVGVNKVGERFDLFTTFGVGELNRALRLGLEEVRLHYHLSWDSENEKEELYANGLFESSQVKGAWFRTKTNLDPAGHSDDPWIALNNWEVFENQGRVFIQVPFQYTPAREYFANKEVRIEYVARYTVGADFVASPDDQFIMDDSAIVGGDLNRQLARVRERLFYMRTLSCGAADREYWGMMLQDARQALVAFEVNRPRQRARKALVTRWGKYASQSI